MNACGAFAACIRSRLSPPLPYRGYAMCDLRPMTYAYPICVYIYMSTRWFFVLLSFLGVIETCGVLVSETIAPPSA